MGLDFFTDSFDRVTASIPLVLTIKFYHITIAFATVHLNSKLLQYNLHSESQLTTTPVYFYLDVNNLPSPTLTCILNLQLHFAILGRVP